MIRLRYFILNYFPFVAFTALMGAIAPQAVVFMTLLSYAASTGDVAAASGNPVPKAARVGAPVYLLFVFIMIAFFIRILFAYHYVVILCAAALCVAAAVSKKISPRISIAIFLNVLVVMFFIHFLPPNIDSKSFAKLNNEKYARVVFSLKPYIVDSESGIEGVRTIKIDPAETAAFFTVDHGPDARALPSLFKVSLKEEALPATYSGDRLFDIAFAPDGNLLATSYYDSKLLLMNPVDLSVTKALDTSTYPQHIIMDPRGGRVTVLHEGLGIANIYSLPEMTFYDKTKISGAPSKIVVDDESRKAYASNWMYPYLLTETEIFSLRTTRKAVFMGFDGGGVALDKNRDRVYVTRGVTGEVLGIDLKTFNVVDKIKSPSFARPVLVDQKRKLIYVGNTSYPYVRIYDYDGKFIDEIFAGPNCREIVASPASNRILAGTALGVVELKVDMVINSIAQKRKAAEESAER